MGCGASVQVSQALANVLCGPVIGNVTHDTAIVLLEVDMNCIITCKLTKSDGNAIVTSELSLQMTAKVPKAFNFTNLFPDTNYRVSFEGITRSDTHTGSLKTFRKPQDIDQIRMIFVSCDRPERLMDNEVNLWETIYKEYANKVDVMFHLGDQVYCNKEFDNGWTVFRRHKQVGKLERAKLEHMVKDTIRDTYRFTWGLPYTREVYANLPHLMIWSDNDIYNDFTTEKVEGIPLDPTMISLGHQVYREYQRQLWDTNYISDTTTNEFHFHQYGSIGVMLLDQRGNRITVEGKQMGDRPLVNDEQWKWLDNCFGNPDLDVMIVCAEIPFVGDTPEEAQAKAATTGFMKDHWPFRKDELVRILETCFNWMSTDPAKKQVVMVAGDIHVGVESIIKDEITGLQIKQLVASPITNHVCKFFPKMEGRVNDRFSYTHTPFDKKRNFGLIEATKDQSGKWKVESKLVLDS